MPASDPQKPRSLPFLTISLAVLALGLIGVLGYRWMAPPPVSGPPAAPEHAPETKVVLNTNVVAPGTVVTAEGVL